MTKKILLAAFLVATPLGAAQAMNIAAFLTKADALEKKGVMALLSSDYKVLKKVVETASGELRAERLSAQKAGRKPAYCPPEKGGLSASELLGHLRAIPSAQRTQLQVKDGLRSLMVRKYPCR